MWLVVELHTSVSYLGSYVQLLLFVSECSRLECKITLLSCQWGPCSCLKVCKHHKLLLVTWWVISLLPLNKQVDNKNHVSKSYLRSILTCLYRGIQYKLGLVCRKIIFRSLSKASQMYFIMFGFYSKCCCENSKFFLWHPTVTPECPLLYTNTSHTRNTYTHWIPKYLIFH